ncbi:MAG: DegT/DnrJ/EryC1/StrS family aminotransferase [bacterium]|nr:DegT/DnrJ/EryC1/StrS family aminotransferase [bacterium]
MSSVESALLALPNDQDATGRDFGIEETTALDAVLASGTLTSTKGTFVKRFEGDFASYVGAAHAIACASGSAAVHTALAALDLEPGDEVITTGITDMGAIAPILYQAAIPVFADVDPRTCNVTAATIEAALSQRTRAIVVTHLFGNPCEMDAILALARAHNIPVIEDAAQAFGARYRGRHVGTLGTIGCFSLQQGKHITCGEGGIVVTDDPALARRIRLFVNKGWPYGESQPDHEFLALNYRMSELQGAVALAQLGKLDRHVEIRRERAHDLTLALRDLAGIATPTIYDGAEHSYWKYALRLDPAVFPEGPTGFARALTDRNVASVPRYIAKPAFLCAVFQQRRTFGHSAFPLTLARPEALDYRIERFPGTAEGLAHILVLPINERYELEHVAYVADAVHAAAATLRSAHA